MVDQMEAMKSSARSHQRRKRLLDARKTVLAPDEEDLWTDITTDMSDEEEGSVDAMRGWIVQLPSFQPGLIQPVCWLDADVRNTAASQAFHSGQPTAETF